MNNLVLKTFNKAVATGITVPFNVLNENSLKHGFIVHPDLCNEEVLNWIKSKESDYNSTFYKKWNDIISKSRIELWEDQLKHYASTYGTNYEGESFIPRKESASPDINISTFKVIMPISKEEVSERCLNMLYSGIALKQETITDVISILAWLNTEINIDKVKNKEAKMFLYKETESLPTEPSEMVRFLVYLSTEKTLLIKDSFTIQTIAANYNLIISELVEKFGYGKLSQVFYRFKPLFLAFRNNEPNRKCINKLRRLAERNHIPMKKGYFEQLLSNPSTVSELPNRLKDITNFKKISLLQAILVRQKELDNRAFVVRNQKLFIKQQKVESNQYLQLIYNVIYSDLVESLKSKSTRIKLPKGVNITLPTSEKSFIGNYPLGTSFDFSDSDNIVGINWKGVDGAQDIDLKMVDIDGRAYGWNVDYKNENNSIIYSGDMTSASPEATELFYTSKGFRPAIVKVNLYNGSPNSKFKFFLAKEKVTNMKRGYMVNPNNILINVDCEMDSNEKTLGVITDKKFILAQFRTGKGRVAYKSVTDLYTEYALNTLDCYISLEKLLSDAGFEITDKNPKIDLTELSKDTLIDLIK